MSEGLLHPSLTRRAPQDAVTVAMPDFMTEWWFLGLMAGLLCFVVVGGAILILIVSLVGSSKKKEREMDERD